MMKRLVPRRMRSGVLLWWLVGGLVTGQARGKPIVPHQPDSLSLPLAGELGSRLNTLSSRLQEPLLPLPSPKLQEPRLPLPSPQDLEAIKKVAQILLMLGEQVIPAIIGAPPPPCDTAAHSDVPNDAVSEEQIQ